MAAVPSGAPLLAAAAEYEERVKFFSNYLHSKRGEWEKKIEMELTNNRYRIPLDIQDLANAEPGMDRLVLDNPVKYLLPWEEALIAFLGDTNPKAVKQLTQQLKLDIKGAFGRNHTTPRGMTAATLQKLMCVEGIVTKAGLAAPKLLQSMHIHKNSDTDGFVTARDHKDATAFVNAPNAGAMPTHDGDGNELVMEMGLSVYKDTQKFFIQETPESAPPGQIPRSVEVVCEGDLVDKAKPGDRVQVIGVYRAFPGAQQDFTTGVFPARLIATSIKPIREMIEAPFVSEDLVNIKNLAARPDVFQVLARSFAPSICGHDRVKAGLLLQLIGGTEKNLPNGAHLRGDINLLLVGDPSCGKSQMLRFVMNTSPLAISTTGRGSSGVGLTAAMTREPGSRDFQLEAGAMVLADRGMICIDEFDKMGEGDRVAIHEAMEQQVVTINKAGMHVTLNARCSVVAAANPIYGNFDPSKSLAENINLPDSLLSRFDLVFVVRDLTTEEIDRKIATQVLRQAMQRLNNDGCRRGVEEVHSSILERRDQQDKSKAQVATEVFEKVLPGADGEVPPEIVTVDFLKKYVRYCKRLTPTLSEEAQAEVADRYVDMRMRFQYGHADMTDPNSEKKPKLAVTTRTLEALIRLATAHAKLKLRKTEVLREDVVEAFKLMLAAREEEDKEDDAIAPPAGDGPGAPGGGGAAIAASSGSAAASPARRKRQRTSGGDAIAPTRLRALQSLVARVFAQAQMQEMTTGELLENVNGALVEGEDAFTEAEFQAGLAQLEEQNKVIVADGGIVMIIA